MVKKACILWLAFALLSLPGAGVAAAQDDYALFRQGAGEASLLFRGHKAFEYDHLFNGTPYWISPDYLPGTVIYNEKPYRDIELNINAARQELIVRIARGVSHKALEQEFVRECTIGGRRFLNLRYLYGPAAPSGYWEVLYDGKNKFVRRVTKQLEPDVDGSKRDQTHYEANYRYDVYKTFTYSAQYCCVKEDGTIVPVRRRGDVRKLIDKPLRREVRRHIRRLEGSELMSFDRYFVEVVRYLDTR